MSQTSKQPSFQDFLEPTNGVDLRTIEAHIAIVTSIGKYASDRDARLTALVYQAEAMRMRIEELTKSNRQLSEELTTAKLQLVEVLANTLTTGRADENAAEKLTKTP